MFKNLTIFKFDPLNLDNHTDINMMLGNYQDTATEMLEAHQPSDPVAEQIMRRGWLPLNPLLVEMATTGNVDHRFLPLSMIIRQRAIDNGAVDLAVRRKIANIQQAESRIVGKKEKTQIKDEILFEMIPKAPVKEKRINGYVCANGHILVDAVGKAAEDYISFVRESVGKLAALQLDIAIPADEIMDVKPTSQLIHQYVLRAINNEHFNFDDVAEQFQFKFTNTFAFINDKEQFAVRDCTSDTLSSAEFYRRVRDGRVVWCNFDNAEVEFRLMSDLSLKAIKFTALDFEHTNDQEATVGAHRMQIQVYNKLVNNIIAEIELANKMNEGEDHE